MTGYIAPHTFLTEYDSRRFPSLEGYSWPFCQFKKINKLGFSGVYGSRIRGFKAFLSYIRRRDRFLYPPSGYKSGFAMRHILVNLFERRFKI